MTKQEALKYANNLIDKIVFISEFEARQDIMVKVFMLGQEYQSGNGKTDGSVNIYGSHSVYQIELNITPISTEQQIANIIFHQMGHIIASGFKAFYDIFSNSDPESYQYQVFERQYQIIAKRIARILKKVYEGSSSMVERLYSY